MTKIPLKTLQFPGLEDKMYVVPEVFISDPNNDGNVELIFGIAPILISFYIDGTSYTPTITGTYYAEEGMTWKQWIYSKYNTAGITGGDTMLGTSNGSLYQSGDSGPIRDAATRVIINGGSYYIGM